MLRAEPLSRCLALLALLLAPRVDAQSTARPGMRLLITTIAASGGASRSGFLLLPPSRTTVSEGACPTYEAVGRSPSGSIREVHLRIASPEGAELDLPFGEGCGHVRLEVTLDDGTVLVPSVGRGTVSIAPGDVHGHLDATIDTGGVPTTLVADFALRPR